MAAEISAAIVSSFRSGSAPMSSLLAKPLAVVAAPVMVPLWACQALSAGPAPAAGL